MSIRPVKQHRAVEADHGGRRRQAAPRLRLRRNRRDSIRFCCSTISATIVRKIISPDFPWHPHRGIETITYVLDGTVEHGDSLGNRGTLGAGDVQWMTAGRGIMHQEMPQGDAQGRMHGFQLWANLPVFAEDDGAALSGHQGCGDSRDRRRRRHPRARRVRRFLGQARPGRRRRRRSALSRRLRAAGKAQDAQGRGRAPRLRLRVRRLRHVSPMPRSRSAC